MNSFIGMNKPASLSIASMFMLLVITSWVAFYLYSSTDWTIKLYEGYGFPQFISMILIFRIRQSWHQKQIEIYEAMRGEFKKPAKLQDDDFKDRRKLALIEIQGLEGESPIDENDLLPTRLGNVLRASELYADEKYKLNSLVMFPKLIHVLPSHFANELEDKNNRFIFLLHSSFLSCILGLVSLIVGLADIIAVPLCKYTFMPNFFANSVCAKGFIYRGFSVLSPGGYLLLGLLFFITGYIIYRISVSAAREFALQIRAGFDLYRFDLLRQLNYQLPATLNEEKQIWELLSEYFIAGNRLQFADVSFPYQYYERSKSNQSKE